MSDVLKSTLDLSGRRVLIFIVAYNAERTLASVLNRIPPELRRPEVEVLVIDDSSRDATFTAGLEYNNPTPELKITILRTPENQGYGGNQKLGYRFAIDNGFEVVAMVHGDGQYAPEKLSDLLGPLIDGKADAVFGSRMIDKKAALEGGMPLYKWVGNQVLTGFQNAVLRTRLSEFHTGYRLYSVDALRQIPFERNANDFHFDTEIIIQFVLKKLRIAELPIPTFYGDEICHVNGLRYAWDVFRTMCRAKLHQMYMFYDRKFDVGIAEETYELKIGYPSSHSLAIEQVRPGATLLDVGCGPGLVAEELAKKARHVTGIEQFAPRRSPSSNVEFHEWDLDVHELPVEVSRYDQIFMLDIIEHLLDPETFMERLRGATGGSRSEVILTTANIGFIVTRLMLLLGSFRYGKAGILDRTHTRLFTFSSLRELMEQAGYKILEVRGIPAPFARAIGINWASRALAVVNQTLIRVSPGLFSYQIFIRAKAQPSVKHLLKETVESSNVLRQAATI